MQNCQFNFLTKITTMSAIIFMGTSLTLSYLGYQASDIQLFDETEPFPVELPGGAPAPPEPAGLQEIPSAEGATGLQEIPTEESQGALAERPPAGDDEAAAEPPPE